MEEKGLQRFGPFFLVRPLGRGGMGEVFLARTTWTHARIAAVKRLRPDVARVPTFAERFKHEADLAVLLRHPRLVQTLEVGNHEGQLYVASALVLGKDAAIIADRLRERGQGAPAAVVVRMLLDILSALSYVHGARDTAGRFLGLVHRDVTPGNVLLGYDGFARLADFGLARSSITEGSHLTGHGEIIGTPHYLAPEVISGDKAEKAADIYGLAAVTYRVLTGMAPFQGTTAEVLFKALSERPRDLRASRPDLPDWFARFVHEMLEQDVKRRPFDSDLLARRLEHEAKEHHLLLSRESVGRWLRQLFETEREQELAEYEALEAFEPEHPNEPSEGTVVLARVDEARALEAPASIPGSLDLDSIGTELDFLADAPLGPVKTEAGNEAFRPAEGEVLPPFGQELSNDTSRGPGSADSGEGAKTPPTGQNEAGFDDEETRRPAGTDLLDPATFDEHRNTETGRDGRALPGFAEPITPPMGAVEPTKPVTKGLAPASDPVVRAAGNKRPGKAANEERPGRPRHADSVVVIPVPPGEKDGVAPTMMLAPQARAGEEKPRTPAPAPANEPDGARAPKRTTITPRTTNRQQRRSGRLRYWLTVVLSVCAAIATGVGIGLWLSSAGAPNVQQAPEYDRLVTRYKALKAEVERRTSSQEPVSGEVPDLLTEAAAGLVNGDLPRAKKAINQLESAVGATAPKATPAPSGLPPLAPSGG